MFIPLYDGNPIRHIRLQWVTLAIIALNVLVHIVITVSADAFPGGSGFFAQAFGHVPSVSNDLRNLREIHQIIPDSLYVLTMITSAFLHADFWHLAGNMLFIWVFGDNVEDALGHMRFVIFYLLCAMAAAWFHSFAFQYSDAPLIGASGAASGIIGAYLVLHPRMKIWALFLFRIPLRLPAWVLLGGWIIFQLFMFITDTTNAISWAAHIGGAVAGAVLVVLMKRRWVPLFDRDLVLPSAAIPKEDATLPDKVKPSPWGRQTKS